MIFIQDSQTQYITHPAIGEKAKELFKLKQFDLEVPRWVVLPADFMAEAFKNLSSLSNTGDLIRAIDDYVFPPSVEAELALFFPTEVHLSVKPSFWLDQGHEDAFENQFESFLAVPREQVIQKIKAVWRSIFSDEVLSYRAKHRLGPNLGIAVIIQQVIAAQSSGVAFGLHPTSGNRKEKFISGVFGLGGTPDGVEADNYTVAAGGIDRQIARKRERLILQQNSEIIAEEVLRIHQHDQAVADEHLHTLSKLLDDLRAENQQFYKLDFVIRDERVYIVQAQPIWRLGQLPDMSGEYTIWDNSSFNENFAGVITPLAFSCIKTYTEADLKIQALFFGASKAVMKRHKGFFSNAVGLINGRLYSNLRVQQTLDAMLPNNRVDIHFLPRKQHTTYTFDTAGVYPGSANEAWWNMVLLTGRMYKRYRNLRRKGAEFRKYTEKAIRRYQNPDWYIKNPHELMQLYLQLERSLLREWDTPFQADFFFHVYFGWLEKQTMPFATNSSRGLAADLLLDTTSLSGLNPLQRRIDIALKIQSSDMLKALFDTEEDKQIWHFIQHDNREETTGLRYMLSDYLADLDEYCVVPQQVDWIQNISDPLDLIATLKDYMHRHISNLDHARELESKMRTSAEEKMDHALRRSPLKRWWYHQTLQNSRDLLRMKEDFQYDYKRLWGIVRRLFSVIGRRFSEEGILEFENDIYFLSKEEVFAFIEGRSITTDLNALVGVRKEEYERFQAMPPTSDQIATYGIPYQHHEFFAPAHEAPIPEKLQGAISCPGNVRGIVRIWNDHKPSELAEGEIIIARSADLKIERKLGAAAALLLERGSVWHPICVMARQMSIPTIVNIDGLIHTLRDGDLVEVDAVLGEVRKIER